jgi:hypothetical protein
VPGWLDPQPPSTDRKDHPMPLASDDATRAIEDLQQRLDRVETHLGLSDLLPLPAPRRPLSWAPPPGWEELPVIEVDPTDKHQRVRGSGDVRIKLPGVPTGPVTVEGFRDVVSIGGSIRALTGSKAGGHDQRMLYIPGGRLVHIEGLELDGSTEGAETDGITANGLGMTLQLQNIRCTGLNGTQASNHADAVQAWLGLARLLVDGLTFTSGYQGLKWQKKAGTAGRMGPALLRRVNGHGLHGQKYLVWPDKDAPATLEDVWVNPVKGRAFGISVWPGTTDRTTRSRAVLSAGELPGELSRATWPGLPNITGHVSEGVPEDGDFVPQGLAGVGYVSPGYATT